MYCKYCGQQIDDNVAHCPHCGAKQDTSPLEKVENFVDDVTEKVDSSTNRVINNVENAFNNSNQTGVRLLKTDRSLLIYIILTIITCGIYELFFIHNLAKDVNEACRDDSEKTPGIGMFIVVWAIRCVAVPTIIALVGGAESMAYAAQHNPSALLSTAVTLPCIIVSVITGLYPLYWRFKLGNKLQRNGNKYGLLINENGSTVVIWDLIGIICCCIGTWYALYILIKNTNTICTAYNNKYVLNKR